MALLCTFGPPYAVNIRSNDHTSNHGTIDDVGVVALQVKVVIVADGGDVGTGGASVVRLPGEGVPIAHQVAVLLGVAAQEVMDLPPGPAAVPP